MLLEEPFRPPHSTSGQTVFTLGIEYIDLILFVYIWSPHSFRMLFPGRVISGMGTGYVSYV